jgi:hypothetical protein
MEVVVVHFKKLFWLLPEEQAKTPIRIACLWVSISTLNFLNRKNKDLRFS